MKLQFINFCGVFFVIYKIIIYLIIKTILSYSFFQEIYIFTFYHWAYNSFLVNFSAWCQNFLIFYFFVLHRNMQLFLNHLLNTLFSPHRIDSINLRPSVFRLLFYFIDQNVKPHDNSYCLGNFTVNLKIKHCIFTNKTVRFLKLVLVILSHLYFHIKCIISLLMENGHLYHLQSFQFLKVSIYLGIL